VGKPEGKNNLVDPGVDGIIILRWFFRLGCGGMDWIELAQDKERWLVLVTVGNETSGSMRCGEFLD